nr:PREDICTED: uncharacterized protein LOC105663183 isoform X6 [Megachile rotundata]
MGFLCGNCWNFNPCCLRLANLVWTQFLKNDRSSDIGQLSDQKGVPKKMYCNVAEYMTNTFFIYCVQKVK